MRKVTRVFAATAVVAGTGLASAAHAAFFSLPRLLNGHIERVAFRDPTLPPMAHTRFCLQYPEDCQVRTSIGNGDMSITEERWADLSTVNRKVNRAIAPQRNLGGVMTEEWLIAPRAGDCNDYAVTKRHELLARGWPSHVLILSEVVTASGEHHLVLVVRAKEADLVLDNLANDIRPIGLTRYRWVRAQSPNNPKFWSTIRITARSIDGV